MPALRSAISRTLSRLVTSPALRGLARKRHALLRTLRGAAAQVHYFHQPDDPYSHLAAMQLEAFTKRYRVQLLAHLVPAPDAAAAPDQERLRTWSTRDAQRLAAHYGLNVPNFSRAFDSLHTDPSSALYAALRQSENPTVTQVPLDAQEKAQALEHGRTLRAKWGHYLGATFYFEGEWYWGIDRLHYLEQRLVDAGLAWTEPASAAPSTAAPTTARALAFPLVPAPNVQLGAMPPVASATPPLVIHFYCSLRSPYTYLAATQVQRLAVHYGASLQIRFVLPMVMRGLPVPLAKRLYIIRDTKREAERLGMPFGNIVDPVGTPTERGLALLHQAIGMGRGLEMAQSFLGGVFADGVDAAGDKGLLALAERAGLSHADMRAALADDSWRTVAEENRNDMLARGLWGVPSFRVNDMPAVWGQDRLWMVEQDLLHMLGETQHSLENKT